MRARQTAVAESVRQTGCSRGAEPVALREHTEKAASELAEEHMRLTSAEAERDRAQTTLVEERQRSEEKMRSLRAELGAKEEELERYVEIATTFCEFCCHRRDRFCYVWI